MCVAGIVVRWWGGSGGFRRVGRVADFLPPRLFRLKEETRDVSPAARTRAYASRRSRRALPPYPLLVRGCPFALWRMTAPFPWRVRVSGYWWPFHDEEAVCVRCPRVAIGQKIFAKMFSKSVFFDRHPSAEGRQDGARRVRPLPEWLRCGELSSTYCSTYSLYQRPWPLPSLCSAPLRHRPNSRPSRLVRSSCLFFCRSPGCGYGASGGGGVRGLRGGWGWGGKCVGHRNKAARVTNRQSLGANIGHKTCGDAQALQLGLVRGFGTKRRAHCGPWGTCIKLACICSCPRPVLEPSSPLQE